MRTYCLTARGTRLCSSYLGQFCKQPKLQALAHRLTAMQSVHSTKQQERTIRHCCFSSTTECGTSGSSLPFEYDEQLSELEQLTASLQHKQLSPGPELLELLSAFEIARSNMLRPSSYFTDFPFSPEQLTEAQQLQQYVSQLTAPVYLNSQLLLLLLTTVHQALQQLAAVAAAAALKYNSDSSTQQQVILGRVLFIKLTSSIAIHAEGAAAAADMAAAALDSYTKGTNTVTDTVPGPTPQAAAVAAVQAALAAVDTALNSTIPLNSSSSSSSSTCYGQGQHCIHNLMLCRLLLASWLPPLAAEAEGICNSPTAVSNMLQNSYSNSQSSLISKDLQDMTDSNVDTAGASNSQCAASADSAVQCHTSVTAAVAAAAAAPAQTESASSAAAAAASGADYDRPHMPMTTRQLLRSALSTLSAISTTSSSSTSSSSDTSDNRHAVAPLLLMTEDQAAVLEPLLIDAGIQQTRTPKDATKQQQQHQQQQQRREGSSADSCHSCALKQNLRTLWIPLVSSSSSTAVAAANHSDRSDRSDRSDHFPMIVQCSDHHDLIKLQTSVALQVHTGPGGHLLLTDLVTVTDQAHQLLQDWRQQQQRFEITENNDHIIIPVGAPVRLLRVTSDVLHLLLRCHPNPGVRQLIYVAGLLPLLQLQEKVLGVILDLRHQLATQYFVPSYTSLVLSGCCLGTAAAAAKLLQQLLPVVRQYACAEYDELSTAAKKAARAAGWYGYGYDDNGHGALPPWDVAYYTNKLTDRLSDLNWGRDIAPYFTLPGLLDRIDALLAATCGLRLLPAAAAVAAAAAGDTMQQQQGGLHSWGPHVLHFVLVDSSSSNSSSNSTEQLDYLTLSTNLSEQQQQQQQQQQRLLKNIILGDIFIELVQGYGFPFTTLLQLPKLQTISSSSSTENAQVPAAAAAAAGRCIISPGSVVIRLPVPTVQPSTSFQQQQQQRVTNTTSNITNNVTEHPPLYLPGPAALKALLHELGHAASYLCPYANLVSLQQQQQQQSNNGPPSSSSNDSSSSSSSSSSSDQSWLFNAAAGSSGLSLLCSPPCGVDLRELNSHLFEHWCRHPAAIVALSRHERLGVPLPQRTALQLPQLLLAAAGPGAGSSMKLHASLLEAWADLILHDGRDLEDHDQINDLDLLTQQQQQQQYDQLSDRDLIIHDEHGYDGDQISDLDHIQLQQQCGNAQQQQQLLTSSLRVQAVRNWLRKYMVPPDVASLDEVEELAAEGPIGGTKAAYVMAKLLAAAAWNVLGLEQQPVGRGVRIDNPLNLSSSSSSSTNASGSVSPGFKLKEVLLRAGCFQPGHHTVMQLLGGHDVLLPELTEAHDAPTAAAVAEDKEDDCGAERRFVIGWLPDLGHNVYQDLDLL